MRSMTKRPLWVISGPSPSYQLKGRCRGQSGRHTTTAGTQLYLCLLGQFQRVIHFNTQVSNRAFELGMPKQ